MNVDMKDSGGYRPSLLEDEEKEILSRILEKYHADRSRIQEEENELGKRLESLRISLRTLEGKIVDVQGLLNEDQKQVRSGPDSPGTAPVANTEVQTIAGSTVGTSYVAGFEMVSVRKESLKDTVYTILKDRESLSLEARARHFRDLVDDVEAMGISVSGKDQGLNLVAHIHDDPRFTRPKPGCYGLLEWYPKNMRKSGERKKPRKRS